MFALTATNDRIIKVRVTATTISYDTRYGKGYFEFTTEANLKRTVTALTNLATRSGKAGTEHCLVTRIFDIEEGMKKQMIAEFAFNGQ
jgi:hypothetical protein